MKRKDNSVLKKIGNRWMILPLSDHNISCDVILYTNEVGATIYNALENETTVDEILTKILSEFDVEESRARADLEAFIKSMKEKGLLND